MDYLSELRKTVGLPTWEEAKTGLRGAVSSLDDSVQSATQGAMDRFEAHTASQQAIVAQQTAQSDADDAAALANSKAVMDDFHQRLQGLRMPWAPAMPPAQPESRSGVSGAAVRRDPDEERGRTNPLAITVRG